MKRAEVARYWEANAETWTRHARAGYDIYRDVLNTPAFLEMLPPVRGLCGLDIGCGEGSNTRELVRLGARMLGIDVAPTFIRHARDAERREPLGVTYLVADGTDLAFASGSFDFATAFMSMMDMADQGRALCEAARVLRPGGFLQFSILHPCFVPPHRRVLRDAERTTRAIEIAGYFDATDGRIDTFWLTNVPPEERDKTEPFRVPRFHRTLSGWVGLIVQAGLVIERFGEPRASVELANAEPALEDTRVAPIFLHIRAIKPAVLPATGPEDAGRKVGDGRNCSAGAAATQETPMTEAFTVRREVHIAASPATVFAFLTDPEKILSWMGAEVRAEAQPGGLYLVKGFGGDRGRVARGEFREVVPVHRLAYSFGWEGREAVPPGSSLVEIDLIDRDGGTLLRMTHSGLPDADQCAAHDKGWAHYLGRLAMAATGRDPGLDRGPT